MLRALFLALFVLVLPLRSGAADDPAAPGANAALRYWRAFATLPKFTEADKFTDAWQKKLAAECLTMPLDAPARDLVSRGKYSLEMLHSGAALPRCEWDIDWEAEGVDALLPQLNAARVLSDLACLRARIRFADGHGAEAIDDTLAGMALGRHASLDGSMITVLVGYAIEHRMIETLALGLPKLGAADIKTLKARLDRLPAGGSPAFALRKCEEGTLVWFIRKVKETKDRDGLLALLSWIDAAEGESRDSGGKARAFLEACGGDAAGIVKFAEETRPSYALIAKKLELPLEQFEKEFDRESARQGNNPVFKMFFPAVRKIRQAQARADVRRALLAAALAVHVEGQAALKNHPDPVMGGQFEYVAFDGGFELRSKMKLQDDKVVSLTVGRRGK